MVGLQNWHFKELLSAAKSKEYKMLLASGGRLLAAWACRFQKIALLPAFTIITRFLSLFQKWIAENNRWISGAILGVGETINAAYTGAVAKDRNSDEGN
jgi:hypothetical protein